MEKNNGKAPDYCEITYKTAPGTAPFAGFPGFGTPEEEPEETTITEAPAQPPAQEVARRMAPRQRPTGMARGEMSEATVGVWVFVALIVVALGILLGLMFRPKPKVPLAELPPPKLESDLAKSTHKSKVKKRRKT
jgi:hypothetical protein